ncbi:putative ATP-dependent DNA ligase [Klebsiella phage KPN7]|uniref:ATP-dependent DNA ligase n=1 Tax=Klebsiella phage KPN7 TaxID=2972462 RepID=A0A976SVA3_9CAUD|nr:putative ATP-dependent DNA ligase [Klebsiella phage KPN7]
MNIFEFLGLPWDHRNHPVQLVKHMEEVPESKRQLPLYAQVKRDGIFSATVVRHDGRVGIFGRTGKKLSNVEHLESRFSCLPAGVYLGELQSMAVDIYLEALSGVVNPDRVNELDFIGQQIKDELYVDFFDMVTLSDFIGGVAVAPFTKRHAGLVKRITAHLAPDISCVYDTYHDNYLPITQCNTWEEVEAFAQKHIDAGREGAVFKRDVDWEAGHKGWRQMKIVRTVAYDLRCIGWEEGKGKYTGKVANLIFKWHGTQKVKAMLGKGWSHEDATRMYNEIKNGGELNVIGRIFTVYGLQDSSKGKIRLPKVGELRHDKEDADA